jgi:glutaredoxin-like protein
MGKKNAGGVVPMLLNDRVRKQVRKKFENLEGEVNLLVFTQEIECDYCHDTRTLVEELAGLSEKIDLQVYDFVSDQEEVRKYGIDKIPAVAVTGPAQKDHGIRFYGVPGGYEFMSLLEAIEMVSKGSSDLSAETREFLDSLDRDLHFQVFVTPTCPYCPGAVILAHALAMASDRVSADMVEVSEFPQLAVKYQVQGVPRTVINETIVQEGAAPEEMLISKLKRELG